MAKKKQTKQQEELLTKVKGYFDDCEEFYSKDYKRNKEDTNFVLGDQWDAAVKKDRNKNKQPVLTENQLLPFALKTVNEIRKARPTISVKPVDDKGDIDTANIYSGLIRSIQYASGAENDYDTSAYNAIVSARGFIKVMTEYESDDSFDQRISISCLEDSFKGYIDPTSKTIDGSDAEYYVEYEEMGIDEFKRSFPEAKFEAEDKDGWYSEKSVRVVDCFYKSYESATLYKVVGLDGEVESTTDKPEGENTVLDTRATSICTIKHARITGDEVLSENDIVGKMLPVVPVYGLVAYKDGKREVYSLIHQAKDPQRMYNFWKSASSEVVGIQSKTPWIGYKGQFSNNPKEWARSNVENIPFLEAEPVELGNGMIAPLPVRQPAPQGSAIMVQESMMARDGIKAALGQYESSIGQMSNEVSGVAIQNRAMQGDNATYHFVDNLAASMRQVGKIIVDMIPEVYSEARMLRILGEDGESNLVGINQPVAKKGNDFLPTEDKENALEYNLDRGKYDVMVEIGSSYGTKRQETFSLLKELMATMPQIAQAAPDLLVKSFDVQYGDEIAKRVRATMDPALLSDDVEASQMQALSKQLQEMQVKLEQSETALLVKEDNAQVKNQLEMEKIKIEAQKVKNDTMKTQAEIRKLDAQTNIAIPAQAMDDVSQSVERLQGEVKDIADAVGLLLDEEENKRQVKNPAEPKEGNING